MGEKRATAFHLRRKELDVSQEQMAVLCGTVQSEISKFESSGEIDPAHIRRWAKAYQWTQKRFKQECDKLTGVLPLWKCGGTTVMEVITCRRRKSERQRVAEFAQTLIHQDRVTPETAPMLNAMVNESRGAM